MKIRAIRVADVGKLRSPVALEGLSGKLDILVGPNELGKSTLLRALDTAFNAKYGASGEDIRNLQPYGGGAPTIEIDFELGAVAYRLRKSFLGPRSAELTEVSSGRALRNADAEGRLEELLRRPRDVGGFGLLWVHQGDSLLSAHVGSKTIAPFRSLVSEAIESAVDGGCMQRLRARVAKAIAAFETGHTPPRATGELKKAQDDVTALRTALAAASERAAAAHARLDELSRATSELAALTAPAAAAARQADVERAAEALKVASERRSALDRVAMRETGLAAAAALARTGLERFQRGLARLDADRKALADAERKKVEIAAAVAKAAADLERARRERDAARSRLETADTRLATMRYREVSRRLDEAREVTRRIARLDSEIAANRASDETVGAARAAHLQVVELDSRLSAAAPRIAIAYEGGASVRVHAGGRDLADREELVATTPVVLAVPGVGRITISPGGGAGLEETTRSRAGAAATRDRHLAAVGAATIAEAESLQDRRRTTIAQRGELAAALKALAPAGLAKLEADAAALARNTGAADAEPDGDGAALESERTQAAQQLAVCDRQLGLAEQAHAGLRERASAVAASIATTAGNVAAVEAELPPPAERDETGKRLEQERIDAVQAHEDALRELAILRGSVPDERAFAQLHADARAATGAVGEIARCATSLRERIIVLETELARDRDEDVDARVGQLSEACEVAERRLASIREEVAALRLLDRELAAAEAGSLDQVLEPVRSRIAPYLERLFPGARLDLDPTYAPNRLARGSECEVETRLSSGTREQLAIVARLGIGRLLADLGQPMPVVLDDAMVFSDDRRIEAMFSALVDASAHHQVIVFSCREASFRALTGTRLSLSPWVR
jgi:energy-coupling factor transporter ATP-binding protein EcfA2